ncbi:putative PEP-binding protein [Chroococcus sp. FPU101]|uniref:putative PEP-binding protein n=1 Tax=Chroococcus sp. FPU101 TaxID=1974212 RepID=UPI001A8C5687|nr:putative PEP-binding protein [Chroococcus sp. FPU101]GFE69771.1 PEP-utilising protein mobile region [Chroococcus sp. FPU101]
MLDPVVLTILLVILHWLNQIQASERIKVGKKAFLLSRLAQKGYPVFSGFVVNTTTFQAFLEKLEDFKSLLADFPQTSLYLDIHNPKALQLIAQNSRHAILDTQLSSDELTTIVEAAKQLNSNTLIFRSSLSLPSTSAKYPSGLLSSQVCWNQLESIELTLKTIWSELFSAKSLFYWQRLGIPLEKVNLAILVQPLNNVTATGKILIQPHLMQIQATWGLGYSLLKGDVSPDLYEVDSQTGRIIRKQLGVKYCAYQVPTQFDKNESDLLKLNSLSLEKQESYCLNDDFLAHLFQMVRNLWLENPTVTGIDWSLITEQSPQFYITKVQFNQLSSLSENSDNSSTSMISQGLGASSGIVTAPILIILEIPTDLKREMSGSILITREITSAWLPLLKQASGLILEQGSMTSHGAIIARELGIPAIVGIPNATQLFTSGETVVLDGNTGKIHRGKALQVPVTPQKNNINPDAESINYPIITQLMVNISQKKSIEKTMDKPIDGIGLLRSEWLLSEWFTKHSLENLLELSFQEQLLTELIELIEPFVQAFHPKPVFYRTFDSLEKTTLGKRGTYNYLQNPILFDLELQAIQHLQKQGYYNIKLILPFVRSVEEFRFCQQRIIQTGLTQFPLFQIWMMAEVPSVLFLLPEYVKAGVQGIAIGSNDLTQLLLGIEREDSQLSQHYNAYHPAMQMAFKQLIQQTKMLKIPCSMCGQAVVQYPELIDSLVEWGITAISVEPESVPIVYQAIAKGEYRLYLEVARQNRNPINYHTGSE